MMEQLAAHELGGITKPGHQNPDVFMTESGRIEEIDVWALAGPGVWRRVLEELERRGIEDRNKIMKAWEYGLIGEWHY